MKNRCHGVFFGHFLSDVTYSNGLTVAAEDYPDSCLNFLSAISPETEKKSSNGPLMEIPDKVQVCNSMSLDVTLNAKFHF